MRVIGIGLVELHADGILGVPGIEANDGQAVLARLKGQPVRHLYGLQADARQPSGRVHAKPG